MKGWDFCVSETVTFHVMLAQTAEQSQIDAGVEIVAFLYFGWNSGGESNVINASSGIKWGVAIHIIPINSNMERLRTLVLMVLILSQILPDSFFKTRAIRSRSIDEKADVMNVVNAFQESEY